MMLTIMSERVSNKGKICSVEECEKPASRRGWCGMHYKRWTIHGDPTITLAPVRAKCSIEQCDKLVLGQGFCEKHYRRWKKHGDPLYVKGTKCLIDGCTRLIHARGWCGAHYQRYLSYGDPCLGRPETPEGRFEAKVNRNGPNPTYDPDLGACWIWTGATNREGYGSLSVDGKYWGAHRFGYTLAFGPIPDGLVLDHLCRVTSCVRPDHLEPVETVENIRRGFGPAAMNARKTHCPLGHEYTIENTKIQNKGKRACRACARIKGKEQNRLKKLANAAKVIA